MGLRAAEWAALLPLSTLPKASSRAVLSILAVRSNDPGYAAYPSITTMSTALGVTRRTVQRACAELLAAGLIREGEADAVRHMRADRRPKVYDVLTHELLSAERQKAERAQSRQVGAV